MAGAGPPVPRIYRFMATGLGASMWFWVCWGFTSRQSEPGQLTEDAADLLQGKEGRYESPRQVAHSRREAVADTSSQGRSFSAGSTLGNTRRENGEDRDGLVLAGSIVHIVTDTTHLRGQPNKWLFSATGCRASTDLDVEDPQPFLLSHLGDRRGAFSRDLGGSVERPLAARLVQSMAGCFSPLLLLSNCPDLSSSAGYLVSHTMASYNL